MNCFKISAVIPATPKENYEAWLSRKGHTAMTGSSRRREREACGRFTARDGYIFARTLELDTDQRIVQACRTFQVSDEAPDSGPDILLEKDKTGTQITLIHTKLPSGSARSYKQGW